MSIFNQLETIYLEINNDYAAKEVQARFRGHYRLEAKYSSKRQLNDEAYFLFMFTRLEDRVKTLSLQLITRKFNSHIDWKRKRTWEILYKRRDRIPFMDRVALLTEINQPDYQLINSYYQQRNSIAHGGTFLVPIIISNVVTDMQRLYRVLR